MLKRSIKTQVYVKIMISFLLLIGMLTSIITGIVVAFHQAKQTVREEKKEALILVNQNNPLPSNYYTKRVVYKGTTISIVMQRALDQMMKDACSAGICLSLVTDQQNFKETSRMVQEEHQTGLAVDFYRKEDDRYNKKMWNWLDENAANYGFILRYPEGKENKTNQAYLPWHFRFVGETHASQIKQHDWCLEEYLEQERKEGV